MIHLSQHEGFPARSARHQHARLRATPLGAGDDDGAGDGR
jgi:hypothetical protein